MSIKRSIQFIIKPTYACNASCSYCLVHKKAKYTPAMTTKELDILFFKIKEYLLKISPKATHIDFLWIGGEPLLMGDEFFEYIYQKTIKENFFKEIKITHGMQTNLTLYDNKKFPNLKKLLCVNNHPFILGSSFDPFSKNRKLLKGDYKESFLKAYFRLKEDGGNIGVIYVVTKEGIKKAKELYKYFKNLQINSFTITSPSSFDGNYDQEIFGFSQKEYGEFLIELWKTWQEDNFFMKITPFMGWYNLKYKKNENLLRCHNLFDCSKDIFGISPTLDVYECDNTMHINEKPLGNLKEENLIEIQKRKKLFSYKKILKNSECFSCKWWDFCKGGCPYESKEYYQNEIGKTYWCESYKMLFEYIEA